MISPPAAGARPASSAGLSGRGCPRRVPAGPVRYQSLNEASTRWVGFAAEQVDSLPGVEWHLSDAWARRGEPNIVLGHYGALRAGIGSEMRRLAQLPAGGALTAGCAKTINCYIDRDIDEVAHLPVPAGPAGRAGHDPVRRVPVCNGGVSAAGEGIWLTPAGSSAPQSAMRRP